ncbi:unnamed protein product [Allacma fusca]|uniref:Uncharacterized protein n=1 Tax=Allacma fusca TaxID=39272 RepID=A0A8J2KU34_9HEXA|nr:unnamed protein product [Allacma fusca]
MPKIKIVDNLTSEIAVVPINNSGFSIQTYESSFLIGPFKWSPAFRADWWQLKRAQVRASTTSSSNLHCTELYTLCVKVEVYVEGPVRKDYICNLWLEALLSYCAVSAVYKVGSFFNA